MLVVPPSATTDWRKHSIAAHGDAGVWRPIVIRQAITAD